MRIFAARPSIIVDSLPTSVGRADLEGKEMDRLLLTWEQRRWMRGRFTTERGREIGVALPTTNANRIRSDYVLREPIGI